MNAHFFGVKRAFHATLRVARPVLARFGLTPARFDLLSRLLFSHAHRTLQSELRRALGVTAATVSRMLRSLEDLGFVARTRSPYEGRQRVVRLTDKGLSRIRIAHDEVIESGYSDLAVDRGIGGDRWFEAGHCLFEKDAAESLFKRMRAAYGDTATLYYPWHPDD